MYFLLICPHFTIVIYTCQLSNREMYSARVTQCKYVARTLFFVAPWGENQGAINDVSVSNSFFRAVHNGHRSPRQFSLSCMPRCSKHRVCLVIGDATYKGTAKVPFRQIVFVSPTEYNLLCRIFFPSLLLGTIVFFSFFSRAPLCNFFW